MMIKIPIPGTEYAIEFDSDKIDTVHMPREVADDGPGEHRLTGPNSLILRFATLADAPKWVEPYVPNMDDPGTYVTMTESEFADWSQRHGVRWEGQ
jgi:hypothetical protein